MEFPTKENLNPRKHMFLLILRLWFGQFSSRKCLYKKNLSSKSCRLLVLKLVVFFVCLLYSCQISYCIYCFLCPGSWHVTLKAHLSQSSATSITSSKDLVDSVVILQIMQQLTILVTFF